MWWICIEVKRPNFGVKVVGYMGDAGYMGAKLVPSLGRGTDIPSRYGFRLQAPLSL